MPTMDILNSIHFARFKTLEELGLSVAALLLVYQIGLMIYRVFFHPLSKFPGPKSLAVSRLPHLYQDKILGTFAKNVRQLHEKYGPIVRISPTRLSINGPFVWQDVFGRQSKNPEFSKVKDFFSGNHYSIIVSDTEDHRRQRRLLAHGFSETALLEQEGTVKVHVDCFIKRLWEHAKSKKPINIVRLLNYITFDIIGDLAFAEPFKTFDSTKNHFWIDMLCESVRANSRLYFLSHFPLLRPLLLLVLDKSEFEKRDKVRQLAYEKTDLRLETERVDGRKDIMTYVLRHNDERGMRHEEILDTGEVLIGAGSDTTATATSGLVYYLTRNPPAYKRLADEIRAAFASEEEITMRSSAQLPYLAACIDEALRVYPPAAETPPRISPGGYVNGEYVPEGTYISVYQWAANHSRDNFQEPDSFIPERWLPKSHPFYDERYESDNKAIVKPFSYGSRDCIGKNLAKAEIRLFACRMLWNFDYEVVPGHEDWDQQRVFITWEKKPLPISIIPVSRSG